MIEWMRANSGLMTALAALSILMMAMGLILVPLLVARMPADFFVRAAPDAQSWWSRHPVGRLLVRLAKNALGALLVLAGIAMLVLPGQGILTILVGLGFLEFPGKRRFQLAVLRLPLIRRALDWLRERAGSPPLVLEAAKEGDEARADAVETEV